IDLGLVAIVHAGRDDVGLVLLEDLLDQFAVLAGVLHGQGHDVHEYPFADSGSASFSAASQISRSPISLDSILHWVVCANTGPRRTTSCSKWVMQLASSASGAVEHGARPDSPVVEGGAERLNEISRAPQWSWADSRADSRAVAHP